MATREIDWLIDRRISSKSAFGWYISLTIISHQLFLSLSRWKQFYWFIFSFLDLSRFFFPSVDRFFGYPQIFFSYMYIILFTHTLHYEYLPTTFILIVYSKLVGNYSTKIRWIYAFTLHLNINTLPNLFCLSKPWVRITKQPLLTISYPEPPWIHSRL